MSTYYFEFKLLRRLILKLGLKLVVLNYLFLLKQVLGLPHGLLFVLTLENVEFCRIEGLREGFRSLEASELFVQILLLLHMLRVIHDFQMHGYDDVRVLKAGDNLHDRVLSEREFLSQCRVLVDQRLQVHHPVETRMTKAVLNLILH